MAGNRKVILMRLLTIHGIIFKDKVKYSCNRCIYFICRGKSMLTQTAMFVVIVLDETISQGDASER